MFAFCLFVCLFRICRSTREFFTYGDVNITSDWLQNVSNARHSWPLSSESFLACHTFCDTEHPLIMVISKDPWYSHLLPSVWQYSCKYLFLRLGSVADSNTQPSACGVWYLRTVLEKKNVNLSVLVWDINKSSFSVYKVFYSITVACA